MYTVAIAQPFPPKVGERNLTRQYIIRITFKGGFSEGAFILSFCVQLPDIALKREQPAAALLLYEREDVYFRLPRDWDFHSLQGAAFFRH